MPWLFFILAIACFAMVFITKSVGLAVICLIGALGFLLAWVYGLASQRLGNTQRSESQLLDPKMIEQMRQQAEQGRRDKRIPPSI